MLIDHHLPMVIIVGTSHSIQIGLDGVNVAADEEFKLFLEKLCKARKIRAIAEEMNTEALAERNCATSIPARLAESLQIQHRFCDPCRTERTTLGIFQENDIRAQAFLSGWPETEISTRILAEHTKRERYWLNQLRSLNRWPVLFVCGANHVCSFHALLGQEDVTACVETEDWEYNNTVAKSGVAHKFSSCQD
jgi:hypothetical protein